MKILLFLYGIALSVIVPIDATFASEIISLKKSLALELTTPHLQRGAFFYQNYCAGCHSLTYFPHNLEARALLLSASSKQILPRSYPWRIALNPEDARKWFGVVPPDLSLITRQRGTRWLYNYLNSFYNDKSRPFGSNNLMFPEVAMPNVLASLTGDRVLKITHTHLPYLEMDKKSPLTMNQINEVLVDLVCFLAYVGEPKQQVRYYLGVWVIVFLLLLLIPLYYVKKGYSH